MPIIRSRSGESSERSFPRPIDWLLVLFSGLDEPLDRVRIQKALFLFAERTKAPKDQKYRFSAYYYGPFSFDIYPVLDRLVAQGHLRTSVSPGTTWPSYALTPSGEAHAHNVEGRLPPNRLQVLKDIREYVVDKSFRELLQEIYRLYPDYAERSVFR